MGNSPRSSVTSFFTAAGDRPRLFSDTGFLKGPGDGEAGSARLGIEELVGFGRNG
jgi:hypothetical protein